MTVSEAVKLGKERLFRAGIEGAVLDCELLLCEAAGLSRIEIITKNDCCLKTREEELFFEYIKRREKKEPIAYITGSKEFMGLNFRLSRETLIPRPDTEILVEEVIKMSRERGFKSIADIGTGSGAIAVSAAKYVKDITVDAVDISEGAVEMARINAELNFVSERVNFFVGDLFEPVKGKKYDAVVSNPPYIETNEIARLGENVKDFEPLRALDGGEDGLKFYGKIASADMLNNAGMIFFEIGCKQADSVSLILNENGFSQIKVLKDLSGLDRVVCAVFEK